MAEQTRVNFGDRNQALQVGMNSGTITTNTYLPPAPGPRKRPSINIPFPRDKNFIGRGDLLDKVKTACSTPASRVALVGLGGVGKSQIAIEYCYRAHDAAAQRNQDLWVFWIHAETRARAEADLKIIAEVVELEGRDSPNANIPQLLGLWLRDVGNGPWLLVVDNADNDSVILDAPQGSANTSGATTANDDTQQALWTYFPYNNHGSILITTRNKSVARKLTDHHDIFEVFPMNKDQALALLSKKAGVQPDMHYGAELVEALDCMPLAISQAGSYIRQRAPRTSIGRYLEEFRKSERHQSSLLNHNEDNLRRDRSASNSVIVTWQISFESIRSTRPSAADLLSLMSFFNRQGIPTWLVQPLDENSGEGKNMGQRPDPNSENLGLNDDSDPLLDNNFEDDIAMLRDYSLIETKGRKDVLEMHSLVQLATRRWLSAKEQTELFKSQFINRLARGFPERFDDIKNRTTCQTLFPHVEGAIYHRPTSVTALEEWAFTLYNGGDYARDIGRYGLAEVMATESRNTCMRTLGDQHPQTRKATMLLGRILQDQGRYKQAQMLFTELVETCKQTLGPTHFDTLKATYYLARVAMVSSRWREAEKLFLELLENCKRTLGSSNNLTLECKIDLASTYMETNRHEEAKELYLEVVEARKRINGHTHPRTLACMVNLGWTYSRLGQLQDAELLLKETLENSRQTLGPTHPDTMRTLSNLALMYSEQGRWKEAEELEMEYLKHCEQSYGRGYPNTVVAMNNLAITWKSLGRIEEAISLMEECVVGSQQVLGSSHTYTLGSMEVLERWKAEEMDNRRKPRRKDKELGNERKSRRESEEMDNGRRSRRKNEETDDGRKSRGKAKEVGYGQMSKRKDE